MNQPQGPGWGPQQQPPQQWQPQQPMSPQPPKKSSSAFLWLLGAFAFVCVLSTVGKFVTGIINGPEIQASLIVSPGVIYVCAEQALSNCELAYRGTNGTAYNYRFDSIVGAYGGCAQNSLEAERECIRHPTSMLLSEVTLLPENRSCYARHGIRSYMVQESVSIEAPFTRNNYTLKCREGQRTYPTVNPAF